MGETGSSKKPREGTWPVGVSSFGLLTFAIFAGTVLKWAQEDFETLGQRVRFDLHRMGEVAIFAFSVIVPQNTPIATRAVSLIREDPKYTRLGILDVGWKQHRGRTGHYSADMELQDDVGPVANTPSIA